MEARIQGRGVSASGMLVSLAPRHREALAVFLQEFDPCPEELHGYFCARDWPIERAVQTLDSWSRGVGLAEGWVPCSTWFWEEAGALAGVINLRHVLTPALEQQGGHIGFAVAPSQRRRGVASQMLAGALVQCRKLGIARALLTCDASNRGSAKTIAGGGGVLDREALHETDQRMQRWYWIVLED